MADSVKKIVDGEGLLTACRLIAGKLTTKVSELANDSKYQTDAEVSAAIAAALAAALADIDMTQYWAKNELVAMTDDEITEIFNTAFTA